MFSDWGMIFFYIYIYLHQPSLYPPCLSVSTQPRCILPASVYPPSLSVPTQPLCTHPASLYPPSLSVSTQPFCNHPASLYPPSFSVSTQNIYPSSLYLHTYILTSPASAYCIHPAPLYPVSTQVLCILYPHRRSVSSQPLCKMHRPQPLSILYPPYLCVST